MPGWRSNGRRALPRAHEAGVMARLGQFLRFGLVGVFNTATSYLVIRLLSGMLELPLASALGYAAGVAQSFALNRFWTFSATRPQAQGRWVGEAARFVAVNLVCGGLFTLVTSLVAPQFGLLAATVAGVALVTPLGFIFNRVFVFR